jgi:hypothetical protein
MLGLLIAGALWLAADGVYALVVAYRLCRWEQSVVWDDDGDPAACRSHTIGTAPAAVLRVHGLNNSPRLFRNPATLLADRGFSVRVLRLPGWAGRKKGRGAKNKKGDGGLFDCCTGI